MDINNKFQSVLNHKTLCGLQFEMEEGEELIMDGVDLQSNLMRGTGCFYMMFFTNKRIILKQTNFQPRSARVFTAEIRTLPWDRVDFVKFEAKGLFTNIVIGGVFRDFSKDQQRDGTSEGGAITPGGGMTLKKRSEIAEALSTILSSMGKQYDFPVMIKGHNEHLSTTTAEKISGMDDYNPIARFSSMVGSLVVLAGVVMGGALTYEYFQNMNANTDPVLAQEVVDTQTPSNLDEVQYLDPETIVSPVPDPTGEYDYVLPTAVEDSILLIAPNPTPAALEYLTANDNRYICYSTNYSGFDGDKAYGYYCNISGSRVAARTSIHILWEDINHSVAYNLLSGNRATIVQNGLSSIGSWSLVEYDGVAFYKVVSSDGSMVWVPVSSTADFR